MQQQQHQYQSSHTALRNRHHHRMQRAALSNVARTAAEHHFIFTPCKNCCLTPNRLFRCMPCLKPLTISPASRPVSPSRASLNPLRQDPSVNIQTFHQPSHNMPACVQPMHPTLYLPYVHMDNKHAPPRNHDHLSIPAAEKNVVDRPLSERTNLPTHIPKIANNMSPIQFAAASALVQPPVPRYLHHSAGHTTTLQVRVGALPVTVIRCSTTRQQQLLVCCC